MYLLIKKLPEIFISVLNRRGEEMTKQVGNKTNIIKFNENAINIGIFSAVTIIPNATELSASLNCTHESEFFYFSITFQKNIFFYF